MVFQRRHGMALLILIIAGMFISTLNAQEKQSTCICHNGVCDPPGCGAAAGPSHQELSAAAAREKRGSCFCHNGDCDPPGCGAESIGYGIGLLVASVFAYLFLH